MDKSVKTMLIVGVVLALLGPLADVFGYKLTVQSMPEPMAVSWYLSSLARLLSFLGASLIAAAIGAHIILKRSQQR